MSTYFIIFFIFYLFGKYNKKINLSYKSISFNSIYETSINNNYDYSSSHYSCDNDRDYGGGASSSW